MKLENIECLIDGDGEISIGRFGPVRCAAVACDESGSLAMLQRKPNETFSKLLERLDKAIEKAWEEGIYTDEINSNHRHP